MSKKIFGTQAGGVCARHADRLAAAAPPRCLFKTQSMYTNVHVLLCRLEAFVHDPLINWRLLNTTDAADTTAIDAQLNSMQVQLVSRACCSAYLRGVCHKAGSESSRALV